MSPLVYSRFEDATGSVHHIALLVGKCECVPAIVLQPLFLSSKPDYSRLVMNNLSPLYWEHAR